MNDEVKEKLMHIQKILDRAIRDIGNDGIVLELHEAQNLVQEIQDILEERDEDGRTTEEIEAGGIRGSES